MYEKTKLEIEAENRIKTMFRELEENGTCNKEVVSTLKLDQTSKDNDPL